jgi:hypothetical protein
MTDVRALQTLLDGGVTDPATLLAAFPGGPVVIPDDGNEHHCPCGRGGYSVWDGDGWLRGKARVVTDDEGRTVSSCHGCDRELEAGT